MLLLSCSDLSRAFDQGPLFEHLGFELHSGDKVGLVGPNGIGKTTLLQILAGLDQPDTGEVRLHAGARAGLLQQRPQYQAGRTLFEEAASALDALLAAHEDLVRTAEELAASTDEARRQGLAARYDRLHELLRHHDAYNVDHRIEQVLDGLGFRVEDYTRPVESFSGGQQSRLMLAKLLLGAPDVLLLDEPSNHLDMAATRWLEDYLVDLSEAMLIVSHDRYFLNRVVSKIFELQGGRLQAYPGNYEAYARLRQERYERDRKAWEAQQDYISKQEEYIRRVHYGQLHKQAQSRRKVLERMERVQRPTQIESPHMHFGAVRRSGDIVVQANRVTKAYDRPLFQNLSLTVEWGRRLGIMGPNGCGKTTLLRVLMGEETPDEGEVRRGELVEFGYYDQHLRSLPTDLPVIRAVWPADPTATEQQMRGLLARFGLKGQQIEQRVGDLSGGERSRACLAKLVASGANVLVLDEPTNHLDLWACEALEAALREFEGTILVVSHDRYFLNQVVDLLIVFEGPGETRLIHGNYDTYERMRSLQPHAEDSKRRSARGPRVKAPAAAERKRKRKFPYRKIEEIEADIVAAETRLRELEERLASPELYRDGDRVKETTSAFEAARAEVQRLYEHWEEAEELN